MAWRLEYIRDRLDVGRETLTHAGILGEEPRLRADGNGARLPTPPNGVLAKDSLGNKASSFFNRSGGAFHSMMKRIAATLLRPFFMAFSAARLAPALSARCQRLRRSYARQCDGYDDCRAL